MLYYRGKGLHHRGEKAGRGGMGMELYELRYFIKVAEMEHMTRAAHELSLSEPALSRVIRKLEEELGVKLFSRRGRSITLTEGGNVLLARSRELLKHAGDIRAELQGVQQLRQPVRLAARAAASVLPELLERFHAANPDVVVSVVQNDNAIIRNQEYDLMIGGSIIQPPKYSSVVLLEDPFRVLLPENHSLAREGAIALKQLEGQDFIGLPPNRFISAIIDQALEAFHVHVRHCIYSDDALMIRNLVERGLGVAIIPAYTLRDIDKQNLCERPISDPFPSLHLVLSWKPGVYQPEPVSRFRKFAIEYFRSLRESEGLG